MRTIWEICCGWVANHVMHLYLLTAGGLTFSDFVDGHYHYGLLVFVMAVIEESRDER